MSRKQYHPERILMSVLGVLLATFWGLLLTGFFTGDKVYYSWAYRVFAATAAVAFAPLILFISFQVKEKIIGRQNDIPPDNE